MPVTVSSEAIVDLASVNAYVGARTPRAAASLIVRLLETFDSLEHLPSRGRPGLIEGTRELTAIWPYVIVYEARNENVRVLRVRHSAQDRS